MMTGKHKNMDNNTSALNNKLTFDPQAIVINLIFAFHLNQNLVNQDGVLSYRVIVHKLRPDASQHFCANIRTLTKFLSNAGQRC